MRAISCRHRLRVSPEVAGDGSLGQHKAELLQLAVDLRRAQPAFSWAKRRINARTSGVNLGRPPHGRDFHHQYSRKPVRCQPTTVSGLTITSASRQRDQVVRKTVQKSRSRGRKGGRGRFLFSTASWLRVRGVRQQYHHVFGRRHEPRQTGRREQESRIPNIIRGPGRPSARQRKLLTSPPAGIGNRQGAGCRWMNIDNYSFGFPLST